MSVCAKISSSKPISAYVTLNLVEAGKLDLDKNVNQYLSSWYVPDNEFTKNQKVTLAPVGKLESRFDCTRFWGYYPGFESIRSYNRKYSIQ